MKAVVTLDENGEIESYITVSRRGYEFAGVRGFTVIETLYIVACLELGLRWLHDRIGERVDVSTIIKQVVKRHPKLAKLLAK